MGAKLIARTTSYSRLVRSRWLIAGGLAALLRVSSVGAQTRPAAATESQPQAFRVVFSSTSACSNPSEFVEQLQRRTRHVRPANAVEPALTFLVSLNSTQSGVQGHLRVQNTDGTGSSREIPGLDCHEVLSAMALIGALMVDPFALTADVLPPPPPTSPTRPTEPTRPDAEPAPSQTWSLGVGQRLNLNRGVLPGLGWGESVFVQAAYPVSGLFHPGVRLAGHFALAEQDTDLVPSLGTGEFEWAAARLAACPLLWAPVPSVGFRPCAFVDAGRVFAGGTRAVEPLEKYYRFWAAAGLELEFEATLVGPLTLGAEAGWMFPLVPPDWFYFLPGRSQVHRFSSGLSAGLGLGLRFF